MGEGAVTFYLKEPEVQDVMWQTYLFQIVPVVVWHSYWDAIPGDFHPIIHVAICRSGNGYDLIGWNMMKIYSLIFDKKRNSPISKFNRNKSALSERKKTTLREREFFIKLPNPTFDSGSFKFYHLQFWSLHGTCRTISELQ